MTPRRKRFLIVAALVAAACAAGLLVARLWLRGAVERAVTKSIGRQFVIAGPLDLSIGRTATITAEEIRIANAPWGAAPELLEARRVRISVSTASLLSRPVRVRAVEIEGVRVALEANDDGLWNWMPEPAPKPGVPQAPPVKAPAPPASPPATKAPPPRPPLVVDRVSLSDLRLEWRAPRAANARAVTVGRLDAERDRASDMIAIDARGALDDEPWSLAGQVGTFEALVGGGAVEHDLRATLGATSLSARGTLGMLASLADPRVELACAGDDVARLLGAIGLRSPVAGPFFLRGRVTPEGRAVAFDAEAGLASVTATARGRFASLLKPGTIDATVDASGPDGSLVGTWTRVRGLPSAPFTLTGRVTLGGRRIQLDGVRVTAGGTTAVVQGSVGLVRGAVGTELSVDGSGSDLAELRALTRVALPGGAFTVRGKFLRRADALAIEGVEVGVSGATVRASGTIGEPPRLPNLDLSVEAAGPDLSPFSGIATVALPAAPFQLRGRVARERRSFLLDGFEAQVADDYVTADATLTRARRLSGSVVQLTAAGPELRAATRRAGLEGTFPAASYELSGRLRIADEGFDLTGVELRAGTVRAGAEGHVAVRSASRRATSLDLRAGGSNAADLSQWGIEGTLPAAPFAASARIGIAPGRVRVEGGEASLGESRLGVDGTIGLDPGLRGTELRFDVRAPDSALASDLAGVPLPAGPLVARGRVVRGQSSIQFDGIDASIGASRATIDGTLGEPPEFEGTRMIASASGPDLALVLGPPTGGLPLPSEAFELSATIEGGASSFVANDLRARLGGSDVGGVLTLRRGARPFVDADLRSNRLDLLDLLGVAGEAESTAVERRAPGAGTARPATGDAPGRGAPRGTSGGATAPAVAIPPAAPDAGARRKPSRFFSETPIPVARLQSLDARVRIPVGELVIAGYRVHDVTLAGALTDGVIRFDRLEAVGPDGGALTASLVLEPFGDGYRLRGEGALAGARLTVHGSDIAPQDAPPLDVELELSGEGRSLAAIAASSNGRLLVTLGAGRLPNNLGDLVTSGVGRALLEALNPFRESSPYTTCECGVAAVRLAEGKAELEPVVARGDKLTIVGKGHVDLGTEAIGLEWTLKPREGVGISAGSIANPYVGLGGTLSAPSLELKTAQAIASTGAAIATAGGTILLRGLYDRVTAEQQVCLEALERARREDERRSFEDAGE